DTPVMHAPERPRFSKSQKASPAKRRQAILRRSFKSRVTVGLLIGVIMGICALPLTRSGPPPYRGIPPSTNYPLTDKTLLKYRDTQNKDAIRDHIWKLYSDLTQGEGSRVPLWETWYNAKEVLAGKRTRNLSPQELQQPMQLLQRSGALEPKLLTIPLLRTTVVYNQELTDYVLRKRLWKAKKIGDLNHQFGSGPGSKPIEQRSIPAVPNTAVALKLIWMLVTSNYGDVGIWDADPDMCPGIPHEPGDDDHRVLVKACVQPDDPNQDAQPCGGPLPQNQVSLSDFHHSQLSPDELKLLLQSDQLKLFDKSIGSSLTVAPAGQVYKVLVGFHLATREIPDWVWATFWWHPHRCKRGSQDFSAGRSQALKTPWRNYVMDATLSMETPHEPVTNDPKRCFNPYLEAPLPGGIASNCMRCHRQAAYPVGCMDVRSGQLSDNNLDYFSNVTKTDYLWTLAIGIHKSGFNDHFVPKCPSDAPVYQCGPRNEANPLTK
ncbi:MAG: hypothetical protein WB992_11495, partial [Bryobacteraceae bacterium]